MHQKGSLMSFASLQSRALVGFQALRVRVEVHLANGLPSFTLVGLVDTEVREAKERVRCAIQNSGLNFPANKRITVNLAPADLPKDSGRFDLPMALGILVASGQLPSDKLAAYEFAGELSLAGDLRPIRGGLAMSLARHAETPQLHWVLPPESAEEAALVPTAKVYKASHLKDVVNHFRGHALASESAPGWCRLTPPTTPPSVTDPLDLADVKGQCLPKRALEIAAAGGHSVLLMGSPGTGKSMLAQRFAGLLPPMSLEEGLASAAIASLAGREILSQWLRRPTRSPHHSATAAALIGGGSPPRPGEISLAHHGVLFLDELPEFPRAALEALREPLETGHITISRAARQAEFPAQFQLIAAMNPCPCGYLGATRPVCRCTPDQVARYQGRLSGPFLDRIDLHVTVPLLPSEVLMKSPAGDNTATTQRRCAAARDRALQRQGKPNSALVGRELDDLQLSPEASQGLHQAATRWAWSSRSTHRTLKVARTIADLVNCEIIDWTHLAEALQYRPAPTHTT
jgi:magnesium chelatase family protein